MKQLYLKIIELLAQLPEIRYADLDCNQLQEEKPPISYPAALVDMDLTKIDEIDSATQSIDASIGIRLVFKAIGESNAIAPATERLRATDYLDVVEKVQHHLQGYEDDVYYPWQCTSIRPEPSRKGLKVVRLTFATSWHDYMSNKDKGILWQASIGRGENQFNDSSTKYLGLFFTSL
ncbi:MAG: hypothetical protein Q4G27_01235 [Flavobacteriaceae bacterium]|nr:hypothetical protein [Flavobacteriaceae bacterium]